MGMKCGADIQQEELNQNGPSYPLQYITEFFGSRFCSHKILCCKQLTAKSNF